MKFQSKLLVIIALYFAFFTHFSEAKQLPELNAKVFKTKLNEIMKAHVSHKKVDPLIAKRAVQNFLEELDPAKSYFIETDIQQWTEPSDDVANQVIADYEKGQFTVFEDIYRTMLKAIDRRHNIEKQIKMDELPKHVNTKEFKDMKWVKNEHELKERIEHIKALQLEAAAKLSDDLKEKSLQRITKRQTKYEEELLNSEPTYHQQFLLSLVLKSFASALDSHTAYFTPAEATQFMINVQQRLFGIGAQLRDDVNGFTITKIIEGGPASKSDLKLKDRVIAVNNEPVVGMEIEDAVELIRGEENSVVVLTVIRETDVDEKKIEEKLDIPITRGEVVIKEMRYETSYEPFGDGVIAYLRLYSFYQDSDTSNSAADLEREFKKIKADHHVKGVILDLRYNTGGLLSQAVSVTGLFITKGIVVSIKDENGEVSHLRDLDGKTMWDGPLIVLVNRLSASASEIVAQTLQDYGRAIILGDDHTYGKGSFQTFTLNTQRKGAENPTGEYKVTRGKYYTVSGKSPQLVGVTSDIVVAGPLSEIDVGEKFIKNPLENDSIKENFDDDLSDVPVNQRDKVALVYKFDLQQKMNLYEPYLEKLRKNSTERLKNNKNYQNFLKELKKEKETGEVEEEDIEAQEYGQNDLQLQETNNVAKDLIILMIEK